MAPAVAKVVCIPPTGKDFFKYYVKLSVKYVLVQGVLIPFSLTKLLSCRADQSLCRHLGLVGVLKMFADWQCVHTCTIVVRDKRGTTQHGQEVCSREGQSPQLMNSTSLACLVICFDTPVHWEILI